MNKTQFTQNILTQNGLLSQEHMMTLLKKNRDSFYLGDGRDEGRFITIGLDPYKTISLKSDSAIVVMNEVFKEVDKYKNEKVLLNIPFASGAVGIVNFNYAYALEKVRGVSSLNEQSLGFVNFYHYLIVLDKKMNKTHFIQTTEYSEKNKKESFEKLVQFKDSIMSFIKKSRSSNTSIKLKGSTCQKAFEKMVNDIKNEIHLGNIFQCVISEKREFELTGDAINLFSSLVANNKVPHLYYLRQGDNIVMGASPERLISVGRSGKVSSLPIAGTRKRGLTEEDDHLKAKELMSCEKEKAEHLMLVDLARNDLGKVSLPKSVKVREYLKLKKYDTVMHLVSKVEGILESKNNALSAFNACFPAGTLSGAPKNEALKNILKREGFDRGAYGGALFTYDVTGMFDSVLAIRSLQIQGTQGSYGVGAGIVYDSVSEDEYKEICNKAKTIEKTLKEFVA